MGTFDRVFGSVIPGFITPVITLWVFWWGSYLLGADEPGIRFWSIAGIITGIAVAAILIKKLVSVFYLLPTPVLIALYLTYTAGIFGFFMGVPVFNIVPGVLAGVYMGRKAALAGRSEETFAAELRQTNLFAAAVLLLLCSFSAFIALADPHTAANLEGMFGLGFSVTPTHVWLLIVSGGASLLLVQYGLICLAGRKAFGYARRPGPLKAAAGRPGPGRY